jgi:hypothetical protein
LKNKSEESKIDSALFESARYVFSEYDSSKDFKGITFNKGNSKGKKYTIDNNRAISKEQSDDLTQVVANSSSVLPSFKLT